MEGRVLDELILTVVVIYLVAGIFIAWIGWKLTRWGVLKLYFAWRSRSAGILFRDAEGPVEELRWGVFRIAGKELIRDVRCIGREPTEWTDRKGHLLTAEMLTGVFDRQPETLVIGLGIDGAVTCPPAVLSGLRERIPEVLALPTAEACRVFNERVRAGKRAALLAHGTC